MERYHIEFFDRDDRLVAKIRFAARPEDAVQRLAAIDSGVLRIEVRTEA